MACARNKINYLFNDMTNKKLFYLLAGAILVSSVSCVPSKKMIYLQGAEQMMTPPQPVVQNFELTIKPGDKLSVILSTRDNELLLPFSNSKILGTSGNSSNSNNGFVVSEEGMLNLPMLGDVKIVGLTRPDAEKKIEQILINGEYLKDPIVSISFMNIKVSVMGEVSRPGKIEFTGERISILDALSAAGDLTASGKRTNIKVYREENGKRSVYEIDLTNSESVFNSPCFYLQQNDVVYVEPNKAINVKGSPFLTYLGAGASIISVLASLVSLAIVFSK